MKLSDFYTLCEEFAPKKLSDEYCKQYGAYDNSGILIDAGEEITGVLFSLDLSLQAIEKAKKLGANLIVTHHPAIYGSFSSIRMDAPNLLGTKWVECLKNKISVLSMHLNVDTAPCGIDECLADGVYLSAGGKGSAKSGVKAVMHPFEGGGYGRAYSVPEITLDELVGNLEKTFSTQRITVYGDKARKIRSVASFCGAGIDEGSILFAKREGADAVLSSDFKHHFIALAEELGLAVIILTHYASENYGFEKYYEKIRRQTEIPCVYHTDENLL